MRKFLTSSLACLALTFCTNNSIALANKGDDTIPTATKTNGNETIKGALLDRFDKDYYEFIAPEDGELTLSISNKGTTKEVGIENPKGETYTSFYTNASKLGNATRSFGVKKGEAYYIYLELDEHQVVDYSLKVSFKKKKNYESENNDSFRDADPISLNTPIQGALQSRFDEDYFKFTVKEAGRLTLSMENEGAKKYANVHDANGNDLGGLGINTSLPGKSSKNFGLKPGTYYIEMDHDDYLHVPYKVYTKFKKGEFYEKEYNDTMLTASSIQSNKIYNGTLQNTTDIDYYKFKIKKKKTVTFFLSNTKYTDYLTIKNSKNENLTSMTTSTIFNGYSKIKLTLKAGTYYSYVSTNYAQNSHDYKLKIKY